MNFDFWLIALWLIVAFVLTAFGKRKISYDTKGFSEEYQEEARDAVYVSVPSSYFPSCGPRLK